MNTNLGKEIIFSKKQKTLPITSTSQKRKNTFSHSAPKEKRQELADFHENCGTLHPPFISRVQDTSAEYQSACAISSWIRFYCHFVTFHHIMYYTQSYFFWSPKAGSGHSCGVYQTQKKCQFVNLDIMSSCTRPLLDCPPIVFYSSLRKAKIMTPFRQAVNQPSRLRFVVAASFFLISRTHVPTHLLYLAVTGRSKSLEKIVSYSQTTLPLSYELKLATKLPVINGPLPLRTCWFMYVSAIADAVAFKYWKK